MLIVSSAHHCNQYTVPAWNHLISNAGRLGIARQGTTQPAHRSRNRTASTVLYCLDPSSDSLYCHHHLVLPHSDEEAELQYGGKMFVAAEGVFWDLAGGPLRVVAAHMQHRVPCWGYVLQVCVAAVQGSTDGV